MPLPERKQTDGRERGRPSSPPATRTAARARSKPEKERNRGPVPGGGARRAEGPWGSRSCPRHYRGASFSDVVRRSLPQETGRLSRSDRPDVREIQWRSGTNYAAGRRLGARGAKTAPRRGHDTATGTTLVGKSVQVGKLRHERVGSLPEGTGHRARLRPRPTAGGVQPGGPRLGRARSRGEERWIRVTPWAQS